MLEIIFIVIATAAFGYLLYVLLDTQTEEEEIIRDRLYKISKANQVETEENKKENTNFFEYMISFYFEPLIKKMQKNKKENEVSKKDIKQLLKEAGKPYGDDDVLRFKAVQAISGVVGFIIALVLGILFLNFGLPLPLVAMLVLMLGVVGAIAPKFGLRIEINKRTREITYNLPDALDLLVVCVEAGLGLDAALSRVSNEQARTSPVLARELGRVSKDILAGIPRVEAFRNLASRNNVPDLKSFVALLIQTDKLGTSIAQSLRIYADTVRTKRRQRAEKLAAEASVKMVIPLVLFILPSMFVVLLGPAILSLIAQFTGVK